MILSIDGDRLSEPFLEIRQRRSEGDCRRFRILLQTVRVCDDRLSHPPLKITLLPFLLLSLIKVLDYSVYIGRTEAKLLQKNPPYRFLGKIKPKIFLTCELQLLHAAIESRVCAMEEVGVAEGKTAESVETFDTECLDEETCFLVDQVGSLLIRTEVIENEAILEGAV